VSVEMGQLLVGVRVRRGRGRGLLVGARTGGGGRTACWGAMVYSLAHPCSAVDQRACVRAENNFGWGLLGCGICESMPACLPRHWHQYDAGAVAWVSQRTPPPPPFCILMCQAHD